MVIIIYVVDGEQEQDIDMSVGIILVEILMQNIQK